MWLQLQICSIRFDLLLVHDLVLVIIVFIWRFVGNLGNTLRLYGKLLHRLLFPRHDLLNLNDVDLGFHLSLNVGVNNHNVILVQANLRVIDLRTHRYLLLLHLVLLLMLKQSSLDALDSLVVRCIRFHVELGDPTVFEQDVIALHSHCTLQELGMRGTLVICKFAIPQLAHSMLILAGSGDYAALIGPLGHRFLEVNGLRLMSSLRRWWILDSFRGLLPINDVVALQIVVKACEVVHRIRQQWLLFQLCGLGSATKLLNLGSFEVVGLESLMPSRLQLLLLLMMLL